MMGPVYFMARHGHNSKDFSCVIYLENVISKVYLSFKSLAVTLHTPKFNIKKFDVCSHGLRLFCMDLSTTATVTVYSINRVVLYNQGGRCLLRVRH
jgi:hypothetical protein